MVITVIVVTLTLPPPLSIFSSPHGCSLSTPPLPSGGCRPPSSWATASRASAARAPSSSVRDHWIYLSMCICISRCDLDLYVHLETDIDPCWTEGAGRRHHARLRLRRRCHRCVATLILQYMSIFISRCDSDLCAYLETGIDPCWTFELGDGIARVCGAVVIGAWPLRFIFLCLYPSLDAI